MSLEKTSQQQSSEAQKKAWQAPELTTLTVDQTQGPSSGQGDGVLPGGS